MVSTRECVSSNLGRMTWELCHFIIFLILELIYLGSCDFLKYFFYRPSNFTWRLRLENIFPQGHGT
jgi:hypothetical protein